VPSRMADARVRRGCECQPGFGARARSFAAHTGRGVRSRSTLSLPPGSVSRRFLFVLWEGGGNVAPQLALARSLLERGHGVRVLTEDCLADDVVACGARFERFATAPNRARRSEDLIRDWEARTPLGAFARGRDRVMMGPAASYADDTYGALEREPVDALVCDYMLFGPPIAAERAGVPTALIVHNVYMIPEPGKPAPGPGFLPARGPLGRARDRALNRAFIALFSRGLPAVNRARTRHGLPPLRRLVDQLDNVQLVLVLTSESFDFHGSAHPRHVRYVGPVLADPPWVGAWHSPWPEDDVRPLVVVSLSSTYMAQERVLARVIEGLGPLHARVLVTTGPAIDPASLPVRGSTVVVRSAPHAQLFPDAAVVVTHAGMGTVTRALASGVPLVCLPMGRDQLDVAARVVHAGAGLRLRAGAKPAAIRAAVERVMHGPAFQTAARQLGAVLRADAAAHRGIVELESLAADHDAENSRPSR
jgi:MGT family glycosyltransferase